MGWLKRILQGSNSRQRSNRSCEVDDHRSCSDEPHDTEDESTEAEETDNQITHIHSSLENGQVDNFHGEASTKDWVQYKELKLEDAEQTTPFFQQSWALESSVSAYIFQPFPFLYCPNNGNQYHGSYEEDDHCYSDVVNNSADEPMDGDEETYHKVPPSSLVSGEEYLYGAGQGLMQYEGSPMPHGDEQVSEAFDRSLVIQSSSSFDVMNIAGPSPFSFYPNNRDTFQNPQCIHSYSFDDLIIANHKSDGHSNQNVYYKEHRHPICYVCWEPIQVDASGHLYKKHKFWPAKYCRRHDTDGTPRCFCCERLKPREITYSNLDDGRKLCPECHDSAIKDIADCKELEREIRQFFERLDMKVHQPTIPLYLVDRQGMEEEHRVRKKGAHRVCDDRGAIRVFETVGETLGETLGETISSKGPVVYATVEGEQHKLVGYSNVEEIRLLNGCARLHTGHTLAHEMMHAWLALEGYHNLTEEENEGLCEVIAHMWLNSQLSVMSKSKTPPSPQLDFEKRLAEYLRHEIEVRKSKPYGTGFRLAKKATDNYGLKGTLDYIRMTGSFPR